MSAQAESKLSPWRWLTCAPVRKGVELARLVERLINEQRDLLEPEAIAAMEASVARLRAIVVKGSPEEIEAGMAEIEKVAGERLIPYPNAGVRDNVREMLVAIVVLFAFTTFFLQLTKIPTGSLQPTLFGITHKNLRDHPEVQIPGHLERLYLYWSKGISYCEVIARAPGVLTEVEKERTILPFVKRQRIKVGEEWYTIWFPPDQLQMRAELEYGRQYKQGEPIIRLQAVAGDHLLVDRFSYNFFRPQRGDLFVFSTRGIRDIGPNGQDQLYIKRLVALPNERVRIGDDQHLIIDDHRLDAATPHFENVYTFPPRPGLHQYFGHVNEKTANRFGYFYRAPLFPNEQAEHKVGPAHFLAMGDNTLNSSDSRTWGDVPRENIIGKCWFVYWPFTDRFGWGNR